MLLHPRIYSVQNSISNNLKPKLLNFQKRQGLDDNNFWQKELHEWCSFSLCDRFGHFFFKKRQQNDKFCCFILQYTLWTKISTNFEAKLQNFQKATMFRWQQNLTKRTSWMMLIFFVWQIWSFLFQRTATEQQLSLLHPPIYSTH